MYRIKKIVINKIKSAIITYNYLVKNYTDVVWIVGDGRSGTTWLADLVNYKNDYREMFEPFHPGLVDRMKYYKRFQYIRPNNNSEYFRHLTQEVITGKFQHPRVDESNRRLFYRGIIIKDIFANLFIKYVDIHFPKVKKLLIMRNPCAVAVSKLKLSKAGWVMDPIGFLHQDELFEDFLYPFESIIKSVNTDFEKLITIWAIVHYVPFMQLKKGDIHIVFYEDLCNNPVMELKDIFSYISGDKCNLDSKIETIIETPSRTTRYNSVVKKGGNKIGAWRNEITSSQLERAVDILKVFGLDKIYSRYDMPDRKAAELMLDTYY